MKKLIILTVFVFGLTACGSPSPEPRPNPNPVKRPTRQANQIKEPTTKFVYNFEECKDAGYPVMESYPRQCRAGDGTVYTEKIECDDHYEPVCAKFDVVCVTEPCDPVFETITNRCLAREKGNDLYGIVNGECLKALDSTCNSDSDCKPSTNLKAESDCVIDLKCLDKQCIAICAPPIGGY